MKVLGVDYGDRRIGLAVSDSASPVAVAAGTLSIGSEAEALASLAAVAAEMEVDEIVVGLPLTMAGSRGIRAAKTERFVHRLRSRVAVPVALWDERLTTRAAQQALRELGLSSRDARGRDDEIAATILLQSWLDARRSSGGES